VRTSPSDQRSLGPSFASWTLAFAQLGRLSPPRSSYSAGHEIFARTRRSGLIGIGSHTHSHQGAEVEHKAEGEGFEPSSDLTARNGFRDRLQPSYLQEL